MADTTKKILLADNNSSRVKALRKILADHFGIEIETVSNFQRLSLRLESTLADKPLDLVFFADDLPDDKTSSTECGKTSSRFHPAQFSDLLDKNAGLKFCQIYYSDPSAAVVSDHTNLSRLDLSKLQLRMSSKPGEIGPFLEKFEKLIGPKKDRGLPSIKWNKNDWILRGQIRAFSEKRNQNEGETILRQLIYKSLDCKEATVKSMGQGKSGACVFRVSYKADNKTKEFILKLCNDADGKKGDLRKLEYEIKGYRRARESLVQEGVLQHLPELVEQRVIEPNSDEFRKYIIFHKGWCGIRYHFYGGDEFGPVMDLASVLTDSPKDLLEKTKETNIRDLMWDGQNRDESVARAIRLKILQFIIDWLRRDWYGNKVGEMRKLPRERLWDFDGSGIDKFDPKPPYRLSQKTKEEILQFLGGREAELGFRFFPGHWKTVFRNVREFAEGNGRWVPPRRLSQALQIVRSPAHGDLNANNILLWVKKMHPFLIDFPFFQENGHAMQDLAQLECEVKFSLMDRQSGVDANDLIAYDYTHTQLAVWRALEDYLLEEKESHEKTVEWPKNGYHLNAKLTREMVNRVRECGMAVRKAHGLGSSTEDFYNEYFPALLYHTVRNISYESLSVFKRLLAVYSAGRLIETMR